MTKTKIWTCPDFRFENLDMSRFCSRPAMLVPPSAQPCFYRVCSLGACAQHHPETSAPTTLALHFVCVVRLVWVLPCSAWALPRVAGDGWDWAGVWVVGLCKRFSGYNAGRKRLGPYVVTEIAMLTRIVVGVALGNALPLAANASKCEAKQTD